MICPHCQIGTSPNFSRTTVGGEVKANGTYRFDTKTGNCTECGKLIVLAEFFRPILVDGGRAPQQVDTMAMLLYPQHLPSRLVPPEVADEYARDFRESCLVLRDSPKASAALSRRLLQHILREKGGFKDRDLDKEIQKAIDSNTLPGDLADDLDMVRTVGNFAAHPIKSTNTGEVVNVEPGEAEALLDLLEELLDHYFVRPAKRQKKRDALNAKLADVGKRPLKGTPPATRSGTGT